MGLEQSAAFQVVAKFLLCTNVYNFDDKYLCLNKSAVHGQIQITCARTNAKTDTDRAEPAAFPAA